MGTPFITFLGPSKLEGYCRGKSRENQPSSIPTAFLDAMEVREEVFVVEQKVPLENEFDSDDARCCHWIIYSSVKTIEQAEVRDENGDVIQPRKSSTRSTPIGTIRLVPFPHDPHPVEGGKYWDGVLEGEKKEKPWAEPTGKKTYITDRSTVFHDGKEPYFKLGRLAVAKDFRGHRIAGQLVNTVLKWLQENPTYFNPSVKQVGLENLGPAGQRGEAPQWKGLICVHAQEQVKDAWAKWGFKVDEGMGRWEEEGIPHVGMFLRLNIDSRPFLF